MSSWRRAIRSRARLAAAAATRQPAARSALGGHLGVGSPLGGHQKCGVTARWRRPAPPCSHRRPASPRPALRARGVERGSHA
eukprot:521183-Prymnesium_polylepis.1